jgi:hypothetical protein
MQHYLGICKKCSGAVFWDTDKEKATFNPVDDCLCEVPYPKDFLDVWIEGFTSLNIEDSYSFWIAGRESFMAEIEGFYIKK